MKVYSVTLSFSKEVIGKKQAWLWDIQTGERFKLNNTAGMFSLELGYAESKLLVFDSMRTGKPYKPLPVIGENSKLVNDWSVEWQHINGQVLHTQMKELRDIRDIAGFSAFCGTVYLQSRY